MYVCMYVCMYVSLVRFPRRIYRMILTRSIHKPCRCRHGYFHVVNNDYTHWEMYAIGGSANPTINSQGNRYLAPANAFAKEVY
jgi:pectate lyase